MTNMRVYIIKYDLKGIQPYIKQSFISNDVTEAKLYFQGYIFGEKNSHNYSLYQIGEIDKFLNFTPKRIYICNGFKINENEKTGLEKIKETSKIIQEYKERGKMEQKEIIKFLFKGEEICKQQKLQI